MHPLKLGLGLAAVAVFVVFGVLRLLRSDEDRVRGLIADAVTAFNDRRALDVIAGFHARWSDESQRPPLDRATLQAALIHVFRTRVDRASGRLQWRCRVPDDSWIVERIDGESGTGAVRFVVELRDATAEAAPLVWSVGVRAELERDEALGWLFRRSTHETVAGARPR